MPRQFTRKKRDEKKSKFDPKLLSIGRDQDCEMRTFELELFCSGPDMLFPVAESRKPIIKAG